MRLRLYNESVSKAPNIALDKIFMGGVHPYYSCTLNSLIYCRIHADGTIDGVGIVRTIGTDQKTENYICLLNNRGIKGDKYGER